MMRSNETQPKRFAAAAGKRRQRPSWSWLVAAASVYSSVQSVQAFSSVASFRTDTQLNVAQPLSANYPYTDQPLQRKRPKGRPESVPGAMKLETLLRFRHSQLLQQQQQDKPPNMSPAEQSAVKSYLKESANAKDASITANQQSIRDSPFARTAAYRRATSYTNKYDPKNSNPRTMPNGLDLHKYYMADLLTTDEEYELGMKVRFMMQAESVHLGLSMELHRLPTILEWAHACGYVDQDDLFVATEADETLRPAGSDELFETLNPDAFIGNGLAKLCGPGRGRGRARKPPPIVLQDFFDDSVYVKQLKAYNALSKQQKASRKNRPVPPKTPVNRGTPTDFVEYLMTCRQAKQRMVQSNMRLVVSIARKYKNLGVNLQDLVQEGSLGLSRAAEKFEPKKGFKFSTYASWWIQQAVFRSIAYHSRTIRLPVHVHNLLNRVRKSRKRLTNELGRAPTNEEMAAALGMTEAKYIKMLHLTKKSISLDVAKYSQNPKDFGFESEDLLGETVELDDETTPERSVNHSLFHDDLRNMLEILEPPERAVLVARYGLKDGLTRTVTTVAAEMKQSKAWVRSQECRGLRKLRRPWYEQKLREHQSALL